MISFTHEGVPYELRFEYEILECCYPPVGLEFVDRESVTVTINTLDHEASAEVTRYYKDPHIWEAGRRAALTKLLKYAFECSDMADNQILLGLVPIAALKRARRAVWQAYLSSRECKKNSGGCTTVQEHKAMVRGASS